jgi:hypothetical protein
MTYSEKIVLVSTSAYLPARDDQFLPDLIAARIELFCATGVGAKEWEDALDWACVGDDGRGEHMIVTTSHEDEALAGVVEFAEQFLTSSQDRPQVIHRQRPLARGQLRVGCSPSWQSATFPSRGPYMLADRPGSAQAV